MSETILVCGGAGYIGSHTAAALLERGYNVVVADNLTTGHREAVLDGAKLIVGDLRDPDFVQAALLKEKPDAVVDFAAYSLVGESMSNPLDYYENNFAGALNLLKAMKNAGIGRIVFSSTASVYGVPEELPILESSKTDPINPYGETKLAVEKMLKWADAAYGIKYTALRYFNAAGAHISGKIGEDHNPETHLIPNIIQAALKDEEAAIFGGDYSTEDGTCVRDYVHVSDLADAHILALNALKKGASATYNLSSSHGFSNLEILKTAEKVTGKKIKYKIGPRRQGDPDVLVASSDKISTELHWRPQYAQLEKIIETAFVWHSSRPR
ncbi:MAG: UDP-glucose 4-epimerase GalE [Peptococcaceae bacterium]|jgi:UDP-glucose 4-epimerase|nr:UDP-glucose 4-epimerase GalE [Peptococcaceae bacterium]